MESEIIYISSDDELSTEKVNRKNSQTDTTKTNNGLIHLKTEVPSSNYDKKKEQNNLKRKISQINNKGNCSIYNHKEKKQKLNSIQDISQMTEKINLNQSESNKDETIIVEPKLIVKEKKNISYVAHDIFPLFISLCLQKSHDDDMKKIVSKLKRRYEKLDPVYTSSESFVSFLSEKRVAIVNDRKKLYVHIQEVMNEIKKGINQQPKRLSDNQTYDAVPSTSYATNDLSANNESESEEDYEDNEDSNNSTNSNKAHQFKKLLRAMKKCKLIIKKLEEAEVNFDDENDSSYIKVERYKQRMVELYNKICKLTGENADAGRAYLRPKHINTTRIVSVDQAITNFINHKITKRRQSEKTGVFTNDLIFPDYRDILQCISRCNEAKNLGLDKRGQEQMAKKAFIDLGDHLQRARRSDYWDTFSLYLENTEDDDPAIKDEELARKLSENRIESNKRLNAVFQKYTEKQEELKEIPIDIDTTSEEEDEGSNMDNNNDSEDDLSTDISNDEYNNNENIDKTLKENKSLVEKENDNINVKNINQNTDKVISNVAEINRSQEECNLESKTEDLAKENIVIISERENNNTIENNLVDIIVTTDNTVNMQTEMQKDPLAFSTNDTNGSKVDMITKDTDETIAKTIKEHTVKIITAEEAKNSGLPIIVVQKNKSSNQPKEEKKPLLRVRSFAKPPTTWDDDRQKTDIDIVDNIADKTTKTVTIDLTKKVQKLVPLNNKSDVQLGTKPASTINSKCRTVYIPTSKIINVKNITNNYVKINTERKEITTPVRKIHGSTVIQVPLICSTTQQNQPQKHNINVTRKEITIPLKQNDKMLRVIQPKKYFIIPQVKIAQQIVPKKNDV